MKRLVVGVIGHVDHGKTALVRALTGIETDRLPEEQARGISIALGFAHCEPAPGITIDLIDMPGHERFVRTMIAGATGIDAVLLVVAANEGIKPQTIEHVDIAALLGIRRVIVAVSKADLVPPQEAERIADDVQLLIEGRGMAAVAQVMTSTLRESGFSELRTALANFVCAHMPRATDESSYLPIDRAFSIVGQGPVVTGTLRGEPIGPGDTLELHPARRLVRVRGVQVHGERATSGQPGQRIAINLRGAEIAELARGMTLAAPGSLVPSQWLTIAIRAVLDAPPLRNGLPLRVLFGTSEVDARLRLLEGDMLEPGASGFAQLHCSIPVTIPAREHLVLRLPAPARTIAGGMVIEPETRRLRRNVPEILARLAELRDCARHTLVGAAVKRAGESGTTLLHLSRITALAPRKVSELLQSEPVVVTRAGLVVAAPDFERLTARIRALLALHPEGLPRGRLRSALGDPGIAALGEALARLMTSRAVHQRGSSFALPRAADDDARTSSEAESAARIAGELQSAGLSPPRPEEIITDPISRRAADRLLRDGVIVRAVDVAKGKEILFHRDAVALAQAILAPLIVRLPGLTAGEIAAALGVSRKFCMPLLGHLDTIRFTIRDGDHRRLHPHAPPR